MRAGVHFNFQNYSDWARFESHGAGPQAVTDQQVYEEDLYLASLVAKERGNKAAADKLLGDAKRIYGGATA